MLVTANGDEFLPDVKLCNEIQAGGLVHQLHTQALSSVWPALHSIVHCDPLPACEFDYGTPLARPTRCYRPRRQQLTPLVLFALSGRLDFSEHWSTHLFADVEDKLCRPHLCSCLRHLRSFLLHLLYSLACCQRVFPTGVFCFRQPMSVLCRRACCRNKPRCAAVARLSHH